MLEQYRDIVCPYCGSLNTLAIDVTAGSEQKFVADCERCCKPILFKIKTAGDLLSVEIEKEVN